MKYLAAFLFFFTLINQTAWAQHEEDISDKNFGAIYLGPTYGQPIGSFRKAYPGSFGLGGTFGLLINPKPGQSPLQIGAEISYLTYGIDKNDFNTSYTLKTTHNIVPLHGVVRLQPQKSGKISPFVDALAGFNVFNSRTKIKEDLVTSTSRKDPEVVARHNDTAFSYGLAAGLDFGGGQKKYFRWNLRVVYLEGAIGKYVKKNGVTTDTQGNPVYNFTHSETSLLMVQLNFLGVLRHYY